MQIHTYIHSFFSQKFVPIHPWLLGKISVHFSDIIVCKGMQPLTCCREVLANCSSSRPKLEKKKNYLRHRCISVANRLRCVLNYALLPYFKFHDNVTPKYFVVCKQSQFMKIVTAKTEVMYYFYIISLHIRRKQVTK